LAKAIPPGFDRAPHFLNELPPGRAEALIIISAALVPSAGKMALKKC